MKAANGNVVKDYDLIKPLPPDGTFFMHLPGVYCANCGETFALYSFSHAQPGQVDANGKPFYSHCFKCRPKSHMNKAQIHPSAVIYPNVVVEDGAYIGPFCVIGAPPEIKGFTGDGKGVVISSGARLEKCVVVDSGAHARTMIGENNMLMSGVHIGHDAFLEPNVTIAPHAVVGGHCRICEGAYIGMNAGIHQYQVIGAFCAIGGNSFVPRLSFKALIQPGQTWAGTPAKYIGENKVGITRAGVDAEMLIQLHQIYLDKYLTRHED